MNFRLLCDPLRGRGWVDPIPGVSLSSTPGYSFEPLRGSSVVFVCLPSLQGAINAAKLACRPTFNWLLFKRPQRFFGWLPVLLVLIGMFFRPGFLVRFFYFFLQKLNGILRHFVKTGRFV